MKYIRSLLIVFLLFLLIPTVNASEIAQASCSSSNYRVEVSGNFLGCYDNYDEAKNKMNSHNSSIGNVAIIINNNKTINAKYAIAKLNSTGNINIYDMNSSTYLTYSTYVSRDSGIDTLLLDHVKSAENGYWYYKVLISGKIGYIYENKITIDPVDSNDELNTYYFVENGYLKHKILGTSGSYTKNLYKAPLYLKENVKYYSFDGIYFYDDFTKLVTDYKKSNNNHYYAINKLPYYNYYLYLPLRAKSNLDSEELNSYMTNSLRLSTESLATGEIFQYVLPDNSVIIPNIEQCDEISNLVLKNACVQQKKFEYSESEYQKAYTACNGNTNCQKAAKNNNVGDWIYYVISGSKKNPLVLTYSNPYQTLNDSQDAELKAKINTCDNTDYGITISPKLQCIENAYTSMGLSGTSVGTLGTIGNRSRLANQGNAFKSIEDNKGINGIFAFSVSINESRGQSFLAVTQNNLFGIGAYDENPTAHASTYENAEAGINGFANMLNSSYTSTFLGNKGSGIASAYASDPYWGEKAVGNYVSYLTATGNSEDFKKYTIGIKINQGAIPVMSSTSTNSTKYYETRTEANIPFIILDQVVGENVNGNNVWYKVQSDFSIVNGSAVKGYTYDYNSVGYIHSSYLYVESEKPIINANNISVYQNTVFNKLKNVSAYDAWDGEITLNSSNVSGDINTGIVGAYQLTYTTTDSDNNTASKTITVNVVEPEKNIPTINAINKTIFIGQTIDLMDGVIATDVEDGDITNKVTVNPSTIDTSSAKEVSVKYSVTDNDGNLSEKTITVIVSDVFKETDGSFGFEKLKYNSNTKKIDIVGYQIITGINNNLSVDISYSLVLVNQETSEQHIIKLSRITDKSQMPYIITDSKYDYTYSWFSESVDLSTIPQGDYDIYIRARGNGQEAKSIFREIFMKELDNKFDKKFEIDGRGYMFRRDYLSNNIPLQLFIRDGGLIANDTPPTIDNMFNSFYSIGLSDSNISIKGTSHSIGGNYSTSTPIIRKIIFENVNTYTKYTFDAGYIDNGDYKVTLNVSDGFDKTRAWFDIQNLDLSSLTNGTYAIYINTNNGSINDYGELNDIFYKELPNSTVKDGREYSIIRNENKRLRLELIIKNI